MWQNFLVKLGVGLFKAMISGISTWIKQSRLEQDASLGRTLKEHVKDVAEVKAVQDKLAKTADDMATEDAKTAESLSAAEMLAHLKEVNKK